MKFKKAKILALLLAALFSLSAVSCAKEKENETQKNETETRETVAENALNTKEGEQAENTGGNVDIMEKVFVWEGNAESGTTTKADTFKTVDIKSKEDLDPYRNSFTALSQDEETDFLADENGKTVLIEIVARQANCSYMVNTVEANDRTVSVWVDETEEESDLASHTFLLVYIPSEVYQNQEISIVFADRNY